jgi:hypothetical protein
MRRQRLLLAVAAAAVIAAVAVVLAPDVFHHKAGPNKVAAYIDSVDGIEQQMRVPLTRLLAAYRGFSAKPASPQTEKKLAAAEQTLRTLQRRLSALPAPPAAAKLRTLLVRLVAAEASGAQEVDELARFLPRFEAVAAESKVAGTNLARALTLAKAPAPPSVHGTPAQIAQEKAAYLAAVAHVALLQAGAVDAYDSALQLVLKRLRAIQPPAMMAPAYQAQVRTFEATRAAGSALARELRTKTRARAPLLSRRLAEAERIAAGAAAQRAEIAAIRAYNARVQAISTMQTQVQSEVSHLQSG